MLPNSKAQQSPSPTAPTAPVPESLPEPLPEGKFQAYRSSRHSVRLVTKTGGRIAFAGHEFLTRSPDLIAYLDEEIAKGLYGITKGAVVSAEDKDPQEVLRRKHIAEYLLEQAKEKAALAMGETKDMGSTKAAGTPSVNPVTSKQVCN